MPPNEPNAARRIVIPPHPWGRDPGHAKRPTRRSAVRVVLGGRSALVVAEVCYFAGKYINAEVEARFLRSLQTMQVTAPANEDWPLIANLVERYSDFPLGGTDASVAVLAEKLGTDLIITLDQRHFRALRMSDGRPFTLLPE